MKNASTGLEEALAVGLHHAAVLAHRGHNSIVQCFDARQPIPYTSRNRVSRAADDDVAFPAATAATAGHATDCYLYKESGVDDNQDDSYAARRAALEEQYRALPPAGSGAYWQRIEEPDPAQRLPLEVLARCFRERKTAGFIEHADRVFITIMERIRPRIQKWTARIATQAKLGTKPQLREDLEQECHMRLWRELADDGPTFLLESFTHKLDRICDHAAHAVMEKAGEWTRRDVEHPTRVPASMRTSLDAIPQSADSPPLADLLPDHHTANEFDWVEWNDLFSKIDQLPQEARAIIHGLFYHEQTQQEIAQELGVSDRTIRNRLKAILEDLRKRYLGGQEGNNV